ncbi:MAG: rRNA maturation RNase YbeY [Alphaproteobacteria bacterium]|nr:rRNA maturation RNase YbeY [Alphaproteobacteria bacterium]
MNKNKIEVIKESPLWEKIDGVEELAENVFAKTWGYLQQNDAFGKFRPQDYGKPVSINLVLGDSAEVHRLNAEFRGVDKPTNVLSFANIDSDDFAAECEDGDIIELGDVIVAFEVLQSEAEVKKISLEHHLAHLLAHGILHILGFDHIEDDEAEEMEAIETAVLKEMNIDNPYKELVE